MKFLKNNGFNRTFMELKFGNKGGSRSCIERFNRTFMELKSSKTCIKNTK